MNEPLADAGGDQVELASLVNLLGGMPPRHLVAIEDSFDRCWCRRHRAPTRGSADIDLSLSMAITKGATSEYYSSLEAAIEPYSNPSRIPAFVGASGTA